MNLNICIYYYKNVHLTVSTGKMYYNNLCIWDTVLHHEYFPDFMIKLFEKF